MLFIPLWKLFSFSRYLSFCLDFLVMQKNNLIRKIRLTSNFVTSRSSSQTMAIQMLINISISKGNQKMKFGELIEFNARNIFLEKSYTNCEGETISRLFSKRIKIEHISGSKVLFSIILLYPRLRTIELY